MRIFKTLKRGLAALVLTGAMALAGSSCGDKPYHSTGSGTDTGSGTNTNTSTNTGTGTGINYAPYIITPNLGTAIEGQNISKTIQGFDNEGDYPLNFSLIDGPAGASITNIDNTNARLDYIPTHTQSDNAYNVTIGVQDSTGEMSNRSYTLPVTNVSDVKYTVKECGSGNPIQGVNVFLGSDNQTTDSFGQCTFPNKLTGSYPVVIKDSLGDYVTYKPKNLVVSKTQEDANALDLEKRVLPESHFNFMEPTVRLSGQICKFDPNATLIFDIYKTEVKNNAPVSPSNVELVRNIILNKLSNRWGYDFTNANILEHDGLPPFVQPDNNHILLYWNNNSGGGINGTWKNGTRILSAYARCNTINGEPTWMNELSNLSTDSDDSNDYPSVRNDPVTQNNFTYADDVVDDFYNNRPEGNTNLNDGNLDNRDIDPD